MSHTWHGYTVTGSEGKALIPTMAAVIVRGEEIVGEVIEVVEGYDVLTLAQVKAINTHGFVALV